MSSYRETAQGEFEIFGHVGKAWLELALALVLAAGGVFMVLYEPLFAWIPFAVAAGLGFHGCRDLETPSARVLCSR